MRTYRLMLLSLVILILAGAVPAPAETAVKNFVVIEADPAWAYAGGRLATPPSRIGEVITPAASARYRVETISFSGRRWETSCGEIRFDLGGARRGAGEVLFAGRRGSSGTGRVDFSSRPSPGIKGTVRRIGRVELPGLPGKNYNH